MSWPWLEQPRSCIILKPLWFSFGLEYEAASRNKWSTNFCIICFTSRPDKISTQISEITYFCINVYLHLTFFPRHKNKLETHLMPITCAFLNLNLNLTVTGIYQTPTPGITEHKTNSERLIICYILRLLELHAFKIKEKKWKKLSYLYLIGYHFTVKILWLYFQHLL